MSRPNVEVTFGKNSAGESEKNDFYVKLFIVEML